MEEASSGQSQPATQNMEGEQIHSSMLTVRETDDQEMGLAVAILELIGKPHTQVTESQSTEVQQVQVLEISQTEAPQGLPDDIQDRNIVEITEISESQKDAIHALETLVQIGQQDIGGHLDQSQADHVVIQFTNEHDEQQNINQEGHSVYPTSLTSVASGVHVFQPQQPELPPAKKIAVPPVTHTTTSPRTRSKFVTHPPTSPRTRSKAKQSQQKVKENQNVTDKSASPEQADTEISKDVAETEESSPKPKQSEEKEDEKDESGEKKNTEEEESLPKPQKTPKKRGSGRRRSSGPRAKRHKSQVLEETENEISNYNQALDETLTDGKNGVSHLCPTCLQPFTRKDNLKVHMRRQHQEELVDETAVMSKLTCFHPDCGVAIYHTSKMIEHMEKEHGLVYQKQNLEFVSFDEFKRWKEEEEASKYVQFSSSSKEKLTKQGSKSLYYICQRNGSDRPHRRKGEIGRKTDRKFHKGSVKSNIWCPGRINAKLNTKTGHISALYISSHSHPISQEDTKHHRLPDLLRKEILAKFARGVSIDEIYNDLHKPRDMENNASPLINKQHMITKRFLYMLRTKVTASKKLHEDEKTSVRLLVENLKSEAFNPVLMYKAAQEATVEGQSIESYVENIQHVSEGTYILALQTKEQLALLENCGSKAFCIDATHASNTSGIQLVTLFVADGYQNVYPVGYLITNHLDDGMMKAFLLAIKSRCPKFQPSLVITDVDNTGLTQLEEIYSQVSFVHLLSRWHIHQAWRKHLKRHIPIITLRQEMYYCLVRIMEEKNVKKFDYMVNAFLTHYAEKSQIFSDYFQVTFASRPKEWASCFLAAESQSRKCVVQDSFHDQMKNFFTQKRKSNKRVDFLTTTLLEIAKNDSWCRDSQQFQTLQKDASGTKFLTNHERGMGIAVDNIKEEGTPDQLWKVSTDLHCHEVRKLKEMCDEDICYLKCLELPCFNLCRHLYRCSCVEELKICKHIHRVHMLRVAHIISVPEHIQTDHLDFTANHLEAAKNLNVPEDVQLSCAEQAVDEEDDDDDDQEVAQIENLKKNCKDMFSLLKDKRVRQLLLQHVCGTISDLVATCDAVKAGAVTVTYEQPMEQAAAVDEGHSAADREVVVSDGQVAVGGGEQVVTIPIETRTQAK